MGASPSDEALLEALRAGQRLGMLGPRPVEDVVDHSVAFVSALAGVGGTVVDLGTGGGVPGLVVAWVRPDLRLRLVDRRARRTDHLRRIVARLGLDDRVEVITADVTSLAREAADAVVARGFGPPVTTLRAAVPLVKPGGVVVISEPPGDAPGRWPASVLAELAVERLPGDRRVAAFRRGST